MTAPFVSALTFLTGFAGASFSADVFAVAFLVVVVFAFFAGASSGSSSRLGLDVVALGAADLAGALAGSFLVAAVFFAGAVKR